MRTPTPAAITRSSALCPWLSNARFWDYLLRNNSQKRTLVFADKIRPKAHEFPAIVHSVVPESHALHQLEDTLFNPVHPLPRTTMKLTSVSLALLACATSVSAQYFSEGWAPGKPVTQEPAPTGSPGQQRQPAAQQQQQGGKKFSLDFTSILESDTVSNLLGKVGINITSQLEAARAQQANIFDSRIPLITDDNYDELIVHEALTKEEEEKRSWFVVM